MISDDVLEIVYLMSFLSHTWREILRWFFFFKRNVFQYFTLFRESGNAQLMIHFSPFRDGNSSHIQMLMLSYFFYFAGNAKSVW